MNFGVSRHQTVTLIAALVLSIYAFFLKFVHPKLVPVLIAWRRNFLGFLNTYTSSKIRIDYDPEIWATGPGWKVLPSAYTMFFSCLFAAFFIEGRVVASLNILLLIIPLILSLYYNSRQGIVWSARLNLVHQIITISILIDSYDDMLMRRAIVTRTLATLSLIEHLDEMLLHFCYFYGLLISKFGLFGSTTIQAPLFLFVMLGLPVYFLEIRELICSTDFWKDDSSKFSKLLIASVPILIIFGSFSHASSDAEEFFIRIYSSFHVIMAVALFGLRITYPLLGSYDPASHEEISREENEEFVPRIVLILTLSTCVVIHTAWLFIVVLVFAHLFPTKYWALTSESLLSVYLLAVQTGANHQPTQDLVLNIGFISLATFRVFSAFEIRNCVEILAENSFFYSFIMKVSRNLRLNMVISSLSFISIFVAIICFLIRQLRTRTMKKESDAQAFLLHALKQRFAAVGSSIEDVLEHLPVYSHGSSTATRSSSSHSVTISELAGEEFHFQSPTLSSKLLHDDRRSSLTSASEETLVSNTPRKIPAYQDCSTDENVIRTQNFESLLSNALKECRTGHDRCHIANVVRLIEEGTYMTNPKRDSIFKTIQTWNTAKEINVKLIQFSPNDFDFEVSISWEIMKLILKEWTRHGLALSISAETLPGPADCTLVLTFTCRSNFRLEHFQNIRKLSKFMNLKFRTDSEFELRLHQFTRKSLNNALPLINLQQPTPKRKVDEQFQDCLKGLRFAILDDNLLIRKNLERILNSYLKKRSARVFDFETFDHKKEEENFIFLRGENYYEAVGFPQFIIDNKVDIAIFDLNLDFTDETQPVTLNGHQLATQARELGFKGCQVLHSANFSSKQLLVDSKVFDGLMEKTASRELFMREIVNAWKTHSSSCT